MNPETLSKLDQDFAEFPVLRAEPVPEEEIAAAESELGVTFNEDYREFVHRYGGAIVGPYPIYGLRHAELMNLDQWSVTAVTKYYRREGWPKADEWYVISQDHAGNPIGIDSGGGIYVYDHDAGSALKLADSFENYLLDCLNK